MQLSRSFHRANLEEVREENELKTFYNLADITIRALKAVGIEMRKIPLYTSGTMHYENVLPNHQTLRIASGSYGAAWAGDSFSPFVSVNLREPHGVERVTINNLLFRPGIGNDVYVESGPDNLFIAHKNNEALASGLTEQLRLATNEPERLYGAFAL